jgi:uncharacterized protein YqhQ
LDHDKIFIKHARPTSIGGQAVIEGVMMKGTEDIAVAVRKTNQEIVVKKETLKGISKNKLSNIPIIRGVFSLISAMILGVKCLTYSAEIYEEGWEEEPKGKLEIWIENKFGEKADDILIYLSVFVALVFAIGLFIIVPTIVANFLKTKAQNSLLLNGIEGILRILLFLGYVLLISKMKDIQRVFQYHGAEHKTIHCFESGLPLTVENARNFTTLHPRCGTSFLVIVMIVSIILFSMVGWPNPWMRVVFRVLLMPVVAGISYEIIRWSGKSSSRFVQLISYPGLMLQKLTTREPDDSQLEVAIEALKNVIPKEETSFEEDEGDSACL